MPPPNIQFEQLPAEQKQTNPQQFFAADLERNQNYVKQQYRTQWEMLKKNARNEQQFRQNVNQLMAETDTQLQQLQFKHSQRIAIVNQIEELTGQGLISPEVGQRAVWETAGFKFPQDKTTDWRTEHGRIINEYNRIEDTLEGLDFPKTSGGEYKRGKMSPEEVNRLNLLENAKNVLLQQERSIYEKLPQLEQKAKALQVANFRRERKRKWSFSKFTNWRVGPPPKWFMQGYDNKPVGFTEKIIADMPTARQPAQKIVQDLFVFVQQATARIVY